MPLVAAMLLDAQHNDEHENRTSRHGVSIMWFGGVSYLVSTIILQWPEHLSDMDSLCYTKKREYIFAQLISSSSPPERKSLITTLNSKSTCIVIFGCRPQQMVCYIRLLDGALRILEILLSFVMVTNHGSCKHAPCVMAVIIDSCVCCADTICARHFAFEDG